MDVAAAAGQGAQERSLTRDVFGTYGTRVLIIGLAQGWSVWALFAGAAIQDVVAIGVQSAAVRRLLPQLRFRVATVPAVAVRSFVALSGMALAME